MFANSNFLFEIGTEEIPALYIHPAIVSMKDILEKKLTDSRISFGNIETSATPRRLVISASGMAASQIEDKSEIKGPSTKSAYDSQGNPSKALLGFLKGNNIELKDVIKKETDKGEYIFANKNSEIKSTIEILPSIIEFMVNNIPFPKRMRWSNKKISFARPISYFLALYNDEIVPISISGIKSSNLTRGHYIQHNRMIVINKIEDYEDILLENGVLLNYQKRKENIRNELLLAAKELRGKLIDDEGLLDIVTYLNENPHVITCEFDKVYLDIPDIALITELREHQKCFALRDGNGALMNNFLVVSNNPPTSFIKKGNERVVTARFSDASFFFNEDRKVSLENRINTLKGILFHKDLGTIYEKIERMKCIADHISVKLNLSDETSKKIERAILLCKTDLATAMVSEFASLQGEIGRIYALIDKEDEEVSDAIRDHYRPKFQGDELPNNIVSIVVSLSEKIDNIFGAFSVGNIPKGSVDPYALRRQAAAIIELLIENEINLPLDNVLNNISNKYKNGKELLEKILDFISARAKTNFLEKNIKYDEIDACLSIGYHDYFELFKRVASLNEFRRDENFTEMLLSFKRMNNILTIFRKKNPDYTLNFSTDLLLEDREKELYNFFKSRGDEIQEFLSTNQYIKLFKLLIEGKPVIDSFFDHVLVMDDDISIRDNRLSLIDRIVNLFRNFLDFSKISE